jgi:hypothetical protein
MNIALREHGTDILGSCRCLPQHSSGSCWNCCTVHVGIVVNNESMYHLTQKNKALDRIKVGFQLASVISLSSQHSLSKSYVRMPVAPRRRQKGISLRAAASSTTISTCVLLRGVSMTISALLLKLMRCTVPHSTGHFDQLMHCTRKAIPRCSLPPGGG